MTFVSLEVDAYVAGLAGWQQSTVVRLRALIHEADAEIAEDWVAANR